MRITSICNTMNCTWPIGSRMLQARFKQMPRKDAARVMPRPRLRHQPCRRHPRTPQLPLSPSPTRQTQPVRCLDFQKDRNTSCPVTWEHGGKCGFGQQLPLLASRVPSHLELSNGRVRLAGLLELIRISNNNDGLGMRAGNKGHLLSKHVPDAGCNCA